MSLGNIKDALLHFQRALEIDEAFFGPSHPEVALRSFILGDMFSDLGGLNDARLYLAGSRGREDRIL